ncbi:flavodoxin domain-containing protein [Streptomyces sp. NBC_01176]|uniref:flavodoxin domain-containing protein n=1 Tax=Streptomyces sp. NBC_01176 TaxID=2903760 RepID=UPI00386E1F70|nr:flavodoxin [Streptomyces sp. NBC_01176]
MVSKVLVAYGTTNGSTARIAETIAEVLRKKGLSTEAVPARAVKNIDSYDAVVVGGGLYGGRRHKDARRFVRRYGRALARRPLWLFRSGPLDKSATYKDIPPVSGVRRVMTRLDAREHVTFGGCLEDCAKGFVARNIVSSGKGGDFRDFERIETWSARVGAELLSVAHTG